MENFRCKLLIDRDNNTADLYVYTGRRKKKTRQPIIVIFTSNYYGWKLRRNKRHGTFGRFFRNLVPEIVLGYCIKCIRLDEVISKKDLLDLIDRSHFKCDKKVVLNEFLYL